MDILNFWLCRNCQQVFDLNLPAELGEAPFSDLNLNCPHCLSSRTHWDSDSANFLAAGGSPMVRCAELAAEATQGILPDLTGASWSDLQDIEGSINRQKNAAINNHNYRLASKLRENEKAVLYELEKHRDLKAEKDEGAGHL